jgi:hypothetical protein
MMQKLEAPATFRSLSTRGTNVVFDGRGHCEPDMGTPNQAISAAAPAPESPMRTTLTIDDDVLAAAKAIAQQTDRTIGELVSELARAALRPRAQPSERNGIPLLPVRNPDAVVTPEIVNTLRDKLT